MRVWLASLLIGAAKRLDPLLFYHHPAPEYSYLVIDILLADIGDVAGKKLPPAPRGDDFTNLDGRMRWATQIVKELRRAL